MVLVAAKTALSLTTGTESANQATGTYLNVGKGIHRLIAKASATGMLVSVIVGGMIICRNAAISWFGTTGTLDFLANKMFEQEMPGGQIEIIFSNPTGGTLTVDFVYEFLPTK